MRALRSWLQGRTLPVLTTALVLAFLAALLFAGSALAWCVKPCLHGHETIGQRSRSTCRRRRETFVDTAFPSDSSEESDDAC